MHDIEGTPVSEVEVAKGLGFANVSEFRRWQTEIGRDLAEIKEKLRTAIDERNRFLWNGKRMMVVFDRLTPFLKTLPESEERNDLLLAIGVVMGRQVDWENKIEKWFE